MLIRGGRLPRTMVLLVLAVAGMSVAGPSAALPSTTDPTAVGSVPSSSSSLPAAWKDGSTGTIVITPEDPGSGPRLGASAGRPKKSDPHMCTTTGKIEVDCVTPAGWFSTADNNNCYYKEVSPQPPLNNPAWEGRSAEQAKEGKIYQKTCLSEIMAGGHNWVFLENPPPGYGGVLTPGQLAQRVFEEWKLPAPDIRLLFDPDRPSSDFKAGVPLFLRLHDREALKAQQKTVTAGGASVTVTATPEPAQVEFDMGDGTRTCDQTNYLFDTSLERPELSEPLDPSLCFYRYQRPSVSQPGGRYPIVARVTWTASWSSNNGQAGDLDTREVVSVPVELGVGESQAITPLVRS